MSKEREYKITQSHDNLGYMIYRISGNEKFYKVQWLGKNDWILNRDNAKIFFKKEEALSNLIIARFKGNKTPIRSNVCMV